MTGPGERQAALLARAAGRRDAGDLAAAERLYRQAAEADPRDPEALHHLGGILRRQGRPTEAEAVYRRALALAPGADATRRVLATLVLADGRYDEGFALWEARHQLASMAKPPLPFPEWRGEPLAGKRLLIWPEQGFGDQIQFARFAPVLQARGADVTLVCRPQLARLFAASLGVRVVAAEGAISFPDPDFWVMACSLGWRAGATPETLPAAPYLRPVGPAPARPPGRRIGLMTQGNPGHQNDAHRSLPEAQAERLRRAPAEVVRLEPERTGAKDFADTAALIDQLDLVIAVDTAVAHLAGAMGKPCWVLLPQVETDWRWMRERADSPWYPTARLYRQASGAGWGPVVDRVLADLGGAD